MRRIIIAAKVRVLVLKGTIKALLLLIISSEVSIPSKSPLDPLERPVANRIADQTSSLAGNPTEEVPSALNRKPMVSASSRDKMALQFPYVVKEKLRGSKNS